ncbi:MAG: RNB domain-containing ribonuclease [Anaerolineae bacterium]|nr:RNB domain-containing ribonuclease [Anaerolineae bacterium]
MPAVASNPSPRSGSLVLYKNEPARVTGTERKKITIVRLDGQSLSVRPKDVTLLHPGPVDTLHELRLPDGEPLVAWELLAGSTTTLPELAELAFEAYTPASAWAVWRLLDDGLYFSGTPDEVVAHTPDEVAAEQQARAARAAAEAAWQAFVQRLQQDSFDSETDAEFLQDIEELALGRHEQSRVLRALGRAETPESAHSLLLDVGYWAPEFNPYPQRLRLPATTPTYTLPPLPDEERLDLTHLPAFAIDDAGSDDPDDAFSLDGERLWVHVADVAALVPPGSPADVEAQARGANLYLPEGTVPMLPLAATERLALGLADTSPALSIGFCVDGEGAVADIVIRPSRVRVTRLSYAEAEPLLHEEVLAPFWALLQPRASRRTAAGAIDIDLPEVKIRIHDGEITIRALPNLRSRQIVREAMLAAGEAVARYAQDHAIPIPYATQEPPFSLEDPPDGMAGQFALRRTFQRSQAAITPSLHAGLGLPLYVQATSPLRRYLDLVAHQQLRAFLRHAPLLDEQEILTCIGATEAVRGDVRYAERLSNEHWTLLYLQRRPDWQGEAVVVEQYGQRSKLLIPELAFETQAYLRGNPPLNSVVRIGVTGIDVPGRQLSVDLA